MVNNSFIISSVRTHPLLVIWKHKILKMAKKNKNKKIFLILLIATIIDLLIVDPLPFIDEILLIASTLYYLFKIK